MRLHPALLVAPGLLALVLATTGCQRDGAVPEPSAEAASVTPAERSAPGPGAPTRPSDTAPLPARLAACAPPAPSVVRAASTHGEGADTLLYLERPDVPPTTEWDPAILRLSGGGCRGYRIYETDSEPSDTTVTPPSDPAWEALLNQAFAWHVRRAGSVEALADRFRADVADPLEECPPDDDLGPCLNADWAERFRRAGIDVARPF